MVNAEQLTALMVEVVLGRVQVLRLLIFPHRPGAKTQHTAPRVGQGEHDPPPEAVVEAALPPPLRQTGRRQLVRAESVPLRRA